MNNNLRFKLLPTTLLISKFIDGDPNSNYEIYLREFLNSSEFFLQKSKGETYSGPPIENDGQCDCISSNYKIDFKMLISKSMAQGKSIFSDSISQIIPGAYAYGSSKKSPSDKDYKPIEATVLHNFFRDKSINDLFEIDSTNKSTSQAINDVKSTLNSVNKPKNILCMLPYSYVFDNETDYNSQEKTAVKTISCDYTSFCQYRLSVQPKFETYISFVFHNYFIILQYLKGGLIVVDKISLDKSKTFQHLLKISGYI